MRLQPLKKQPASHAILRRNPFSVYECEVWEARGTSINDVRFFGWREGQQNRTRGVDNLAKIGHPMFLQL